MVIRVPIRNFFHAGRKSVDYMSQFKIQFRNPNGKIIKWLMIFISIKFLLYKNVY